MSKIQNDLSRLLEILEAEFTLLQTDNLDGFETGDQADSLGADSFGDSSVESMLADCRDHHIRNGILLEKKIEVNKNALNILRSSRHSEEVETYDKLGKVRNPKSVGLQSDV